MKRKREKVFIPKTKDDKEIFYFLAMCNDKDGDFLEIPDKKRKTDDYVRLLFIADFFELKAPMDRLLEEAVEKKRLDEIKSAGGSWKTTAIPY